MEVCVLSAVEECQCSLLAVDLISVTGNCLPIMPGLLGACWVRMETMEREALGKHLTG